MTKSEQYRKANQKQKIATKEDAEKMNCKVGSVYLYLPYPETKEQVFERFYNYEAQIQFEAKQELFINKYGKANETIIENELKPLLQFIEKAKKVNTVISFKNEPDLLLNIEERNLNELSRWINGHYDKPNLKYYDILKIINSSTSIWVYATYYLYKDWLEDELSILKYGIPKRNYDNLAKVLKKASAFDTNKDNLRCIIENRKTLDGNKVYWSGSKANAWRFAFHFWGENTEPKVINDIFYFKDKKPIHVKNKPEDPQAKNTFKTIISKY